MVAMLSDADKQDVKIVAGMLHRDIMVKRMIRPSGEDSNDRNLAALEGILQRDDFGNWREVLIMATGTSLCLSDYFAEPEKDSAYMAILAAASKFNLYED